jgi:peroxiredoxin
MNHPSARLLVSLILILVCRTTSSLVAAPPPPPDGVKTIEIGTPAPDFKLPGVDGKTHMLSDYDGADVLAVLFTCNHCPSAQGAEERIKKIVEDYKTDSFQLIAISPNDPDSVRLDELGYTVHGDYLEDMKVHADENGFNFPYLFDGDTQSVSMAYGAMATPHIFVFDKTRRLRYVGRIDDSKNLKEPNSYDARNAIDALLKGTPVPVEITKYHGCSTKWAYKRDKVTEDNAEWESLPVTVEHIDAPALKSLVKNDTDRLRLINVWATWCGPCVAEFPSLVEIGRMYQNRDFEFITISSDSPDKLDKVQKFLQSEHAAAGRRTTAYLKEDQRATNNYLFAVDSTDALVEALDPEWDGPVPHTILVAPGGKIVYRQTGEINPSILKRKIIDQLGRFYD